MTALCVFGVAAHARSAAITQAMAERGAALAMVDYLEVLADGFVAPRAHAYKLDAPGQDERLDAALLALVKPGERARETGELHARQHWFAGYARLLERISALLPASARWLNPPQEVLAMTDKLLCQQRLHAAGAAVPTLLGAVAGFDELCARMDAARLQQVFLKNRYGSSASGVVALRRASGGRWQAFSSARLQDGRLFNHLRVQRSSGRAPIAALVDAICAGGAYAEQWLPKPRAPGVAGHCYDLRVVCHAGQPRQRIARLSRSPLTNLHLGNRRADPAWLDASQQQQIGIALAAVQRAFPGSTSMGVDLLLQDGRAVVLEVNAFGDLLHGVTWEGRSSYQDQAAWCCQ